MVSSTKVSQISGAISKTRLISIAQVWLARVRAGAGSAVGLAELPGCSAAAASACFRRRPRLLFDYQP